MRLDIVPAYGRDYRSQAAVQAAWDEGKDFRIAMVGPHDGQYISKRDIKAGDVIYARYDRQRKQMRLT